MKQSSIIIITLFIADIILLLKYPNNTKQESLAVDDINLNDKSLDIKSEPVQNNQLASQDIVLNDLNDVDSGKTRFNKYYFGGFGENPGYTKCYKTPSREINCNPCAMMNIDEKIIQQSKSRNNEKRVLDGLTSKNLNHYKKNFADELDLEEKLRWWGNDEY